MQGCGSVGRHYCSASAPRTVVAARSLRTCPGTRETPGGRNEIRPSVGESVGGGKEKEESKDLSYWRAHHSDSLTAAANPIAS